MIIQFDPKTMHVQVICGVLEEYAPSDTIKEIHVKVESLKADMAKFMNDVMNPKMQEIQALIDTSNAKYTPQPVKKD